ncbi:aldo/keto reductase [Neglectibacter caecimuris]|uniref:aldo/keto reductase n=1 Tax=Neglectibacter caecimuris TaxID=3093658 RepID=UPI002AC98B98|nr:aldo/keto reductase [Neglectibacter sp. M00184]
MNYITLNNGVKIPQIALGVFQIPENEDTKKACLSAFELGCRHIDTAHHYFNEAGVGAAVRECGIPREELWITSKIWPDEYNDETAIDKMLRRFGLDYLDLVILHQQVGDYIAGYQNLEKAYKAGKVRAIGVSNMESDRLERLLEAAEIKPQIIQVEGHPYFQQAELKERVKAYGTRMEHWFPLGHGDANLIQEPVFTELGRKYGKTNVQIILRWHIQEGNIPLPRSVSPEHQKQNLDIFDFSLTDGEMEQIRKLDQGKRYWTLTLDQQEEKFLDIKLAE